MTLRRPTRTIGLTIVTLAAIGCSHAPLATAPAPESIVHVTFDVAWLRIIAFFANANVPIQTLEKASGLVASQQLTLAPYQQSAWVACRSSFGSVLTALASPGSTYTSNFNVFARPVGDSTYVRVNFLVTAFASTQHGPAPLNCASNGRFEQQLLASLTTPIAGESRVLSVQAPSSAPALARDNSPPAPPASAEPTVDNPSSSPARRPLPSAPISVPNDPNTSVGSAAPISNSRRVAVVPTPRDASPNDAPPPAGSASGPESPVASESIGAPKSEADRQNGWTAFQNGRAYLASHEWSKAERLLREAVRLDGSNPQYHAELGQVYMTLERWPEAEAAFTAAVLLDVDNARYRQLLKESRSH
jgi:hypothetical protein